ncbi:unnamed protein product [Ambrosiozyma monospora]|uniref:Unnamed protein product n=1 Tax=Ambrosiozyma monospora TaxID=43982 RepID=A0A9W7DIT1_AMBMO|nr:unnamed protein product [Ambrosiozyma monospora]
MGPDTELLSYTVSTSTYQFTFNNFGLINLSRQLLGRRASYIYAALTETCTPWTLNVRSILQTVLNHVLGTTTTHFSWYHFLLQCDWKTDSGDRYHHGHQQNPRSSLNIHTGKIPINDSSIGKLALSHGEVGSSFFICSIGYLRLKFNGSSGSRTNQMDTANRRNNTTNSIVISFTIQKILQFSERGKIDCPK